MKFTISRRAFDEGLQHHEDRQRRVNRLATFNSEVGRGILHTPEWTEFMADEQQWFDAGCPREDSFPLAPGLRFQRVSNTGTRSAK